jgi:hypothetical protein
MKLDMEAYITSEDIEVIWINKLKYEADDSFVYICDEIDAMLGKQAVMI